MLVWRMRVEREGHWDGWVRCWAYSVFLFFSLKGARLSSYVGPALEYVCLDLGVDCMPRACTDRAGLETRALRPVL